MVNDPLTLEPTPGAPGADYKEMALDFAANAKEQWAERSQTVREFIVNQPMRSLGIALGMGVVLGWLIKRR